MITRISEPDYNYDIYLVRSDGTGLKQLTAGRRERRARLLVP